MRTQYLPANAPSWPVPNFETTMTEDRLFPLVALSANQRACTLFVAMSMSVDTADWSTFGVCIFFGKTGQIRSGQSV